MSASDPRAPLLRGVSQYDVDFVIPRVGIDVPVGIDPFLLFKSRDAEYRQLHKILVDAFNAGIDAVRRGRTTEAERIFNFPEVSAIGLGYTQRSKRGSGVGAHLTGLIIETLVGSPSLLERGIRHVEEMQLVSAGIGPDRISDIAANILKSFLIDYTKRQCAIWNIALTPSVPVEHVYDQASQNWEDSYEDLPVSPSDGSAILLVPRRLVRVLPWINYDDFLRTEFTSYLAARRESMRKSKKKTPNETQAPDEADQKAKQEVVMVTRKDISLVERYVQSRERQAANAQPAVDYIDEDACVEAEALKKKLSAIAPGRAQCGRVPASRPRNLESLIQPRTN